MIREVDEIPMNQKAMGTSYRQMIRDDINEAMKKCIRRFEFVGNYNYKTLQQTAREVADQMTIDLWREWTRMHSEYRGKTFFTYSDIARLNLFRITSIRKEDNPKERRVFCEIAEDIDGIIAEHMAEAYALYEKQRRRRENA